MSASFNKNKKMNPFQKGKKSRGVENSKRDEQVDIQQARREAIQARSKK